ncbi:MAG TPA: phytanoyl-CoA dioxygenase family protein [Allosphingosinicella sp.]|jgi:ectoine hydroxylase-related dioxygenase (phytanoyl-CoA dioxygenase family)|nr:phytanoyl-CoA dioxygenase family protein [Allosphingosinicella sp.]
MASEMDSVGHFMQEGYAVLPELFSRAECAALISAIDEVVQTAGAAGRLGDVADFEPGATGNGRALRRIFNPYQQHQAFRDLAVDSRLLRFVTAIVGDDVGLQHSKLNLKPPHVGSGVRWHQDLPYFPHTNSDLVAVLVFLDDVSRENGCIELLPRCHDRYFDHALPDGGFAGMITEPLPDAPDRAPVAIEAPAGTVLLLHPLTPHQSSPNASDRWRRLLIFEYRAADAFPIFNGAQIADVEACTHHLCGEKARHARFGGPPPAIYLPNKKARSLFDLQQDAAMSTPGGGEPAAFPETRYARRN